MQSSYSVATLVVFALLAAIVVALHSPGQMSVDSILALYGAMTHVAAGWDVTFLTAVLTWLGGGVVATSLFVAINCSVTYGCFVALLLRHEARAMPGWRLALALVMALNPIFMFYVGIIWKDVLLTTCAMLSGTLLLLANEKSGSKKYVLLAIAIVVAAFLVPLRQQAFLIALPIAFGAAWTGLRGVKCTLSTRIALGCVGLVVCIALSLLFTAAQDMTVKSPGSKQFSFGLLTIRDYDIAGMIAESPETDSHAWTETSPEVVREIRRLYSPQRIDTIWHDPVIRGYFDNMSTKVGWSIWVSGIRHVPFAYLKHRAAGLAYLLGLRSVTGCVPAYWGVYGLPDQVKALGMQESMEPRAKLVARAAAVLYPTPVFRNWFYILILAAATVLIFKLRIGDKMAALSIVLSSWLYLFSYLPTTIACDFRYLYPVAGLATIMIIYELTCPARSLDEMRKSL